MLTKVYITAMKRFCIFSNLLNSQRVGTPIINEWTGLLAMLCCHGKKEVLIFLRQKWLGLAVMGKYHSELLMLFDLTFLMKCKYEVLKVTEYTVTCTSVRIIVLP